ATTAPDATTAHEHVRGAEMVIDVEATCAAPGSKSYHCTVCDQIIPETVEAIPALPHTPEADFYVEQEPTCTTKGSQLKFCEVCGAEIPETREEIDIDPDAHQIDPETIVIVEPTLLAPEGSKTGTCKLCNTNVVEKLDEEIFIIDSTWDVAARADYNEAHRVDWLNHKDLATGVMIKKSINEIKDDDVHYYSTEENPLGNDLLVEISFLWNETLKNTYSWEAMTFGHIDGYDVFNVDSNIHPKERGGFTYEFITPTPAAIAADSSVKTPSTGEYGWHRLGFRVHEDAEIVAGEVKYTYIASCYLDGALVISYDATDYVVNRSASTVTALLYTAEIDAEDNTKLNYFDIGDSEAQSNFKTSYGLIFFEEFFNKAGGYFVFCDLSMTCGRDFVQDVEANAAPTDATFTIDDKGTVDDTTDDLVVPAKIWYKSK
ncbi:MAG: hypothetical protein IKP74_05025, partial [Clostridia bacterium]|nr:hypothetical protein [Clostridia bacterium]